MDTERSSLDFGILSLWSLIRALLARPMRRAAL